MIDYHVHTPFCRHARGTLEQYASRAVEAGLEEICFTPHVPLPRFPRGGSDLRMEPEDLEAYFRGIEGLRARFPSLRILAGVEADYYPGFEGYLEGLLSALPFDLVLLSVHFVAQWPGENWVFGYQFPDRTLAQIYREYLEALKEGIATGLYDCLAHLDLIKRPGTPLLQHCGEEVEEVLSQCAARGMSLEVNTAGLRRPAAAPYPEPEILARAVERGIPVVTGSDAHAPEHVAHGFAELYARLEGLRSARIARYRGRRIAEP
jgi:histidinol-phosphatase (PHP family)